MAVKQQVGVDSTTDARLQRILRALQGISAQDGLKDKYCSEVVIKLGTVQIPTDAVNYTKFISDIKCVQSVLANLFSKPELVFITLKVLYDQISDPAKNLSPAMSIVLQLIEVEMIPNAVKYILSTGYPEQSLERALLTLCVWLTKWTYTDNLGPLVLAFMQGLENEHHYESLVDVSLLTIEQLFKLLILVEFRKSVGPVALYMLSRVQHSPAVFHKCLPHVRIVVEQLEKEKSESSAAYLQKIVNLMVALMEHFPGYRDLYDGLKQVLQPYIPEPNYKFELNCKAWSDGGISTVSLRLEGSGKVGLNNLGNTCYMNSVLQALFMTRTFRNEVLLHKKSMLPLFAKLQVLFALLQHSKKRSLSPIDILSLSRPPGFQPGLQHDSSEFMGYLLDTLHEQEVNFSGATNPDEMDVGASALPSTIVQQSFGGKIATESHCNECGGKSVRIDNFLELQLSFPTNCDNNPSVRSLIDYYLQPEKLCGDNQYRCDTCNRLTDGERITRVIEPPPRLILTLKHFRYDPASQLRTKLLQKVQLDNRLRLNADYELYAAVVHLGSSVDSGHYYTFAKDEQDWFKFNDFTVTKTTTDNLCRLKPPETPYILFYSRRDFVDPENLPCQDLSLDLQIALRKDLAESEAEVRRPMKPYNTRHNRNDEPPPPGCGGGGFSSNNSNMFVC